MPKVSIVIPLYNSARTIAETMTSVLDQTFADFEVVVVNDGSTDRSPEIVLGFVDARIRVFSQKNRGLAGARNAGIREARGQYVALVDADDRWHPDKLAKCVALLDREPWVGVAFTASRLIDDDGQFIGLEQRPSMATFEAAAVFCRNPVGNGSAPVLRRTMLDQIAYHDEKRVRRAWFDEDFRQSEDVECWTRIAATTAWTFGYVPEALTDYRVNADGLSANTDAQLATWRRFRAKVASYAPALVAAHGDRAEAYQLRYLARRAVRSGDGVKALGLMREALGLQPQILREEPARTIMTLSAAAVTGALPKAIASRLVARGMAVSAGRSAA